MSLPSFTPTDITLEESLTMILASIAMEEAGLSHIINAEGEKLQYVLGTLHENNCKHNSTEDILAVNESIRKMLDVILQNQIILKSKMESVLGALDKLKKCPEPCPPKECCQGGANNCRPDKQRPKSIVCCICGKTICDC